MRSKLAVRMHDPGNPVCQRAGGEGLYDEASRAEPSRFHDRVACCDCRSHHHRRIVEGMPAGIQYLKDVGTILAGHDPVQQDQVGRFLKRHFHAFHSAGGFLDVSEADLLQHRCEQPAGKKIVVDNQGREAGGDVKLIDHEPHVRKLP